MLKTASFHVRGTVQQSASWKRAAEAEGFAAVGAWASQALDAYLKQRAQAGRPLPLFWSKGRLKARLLDGSEPELWGWVAAPFGIFRGNPSGPGYVGCHSYVLVYIPTARILATFRFARHCKELASELARLWVRWDGSGTEPPGQDVGPVINRHQVSDQ